MEMITDSLCLAAGMDLVGGKTMITCILHVEKDKMSMPVTWL
jgi:hypothetical protein